MPWAFVVFLVGVVGMSTGMVGLLASQSRQKSEDVAARFRYLVLGGLILGILGLAAAALTGAFHR
jgi:hypothetical protein